VQQLSAVQAQGVSSGVSAQIDDLVAFFNDVARQVQVLEASQTATAPRVDELLGGDVGEGSARIAAALQSGGLSELFDSNDLNEADRRFINEFIQRGIDIQGGRAGILQRAAQVGGAVQDIFGQEQSIIAAGDELIDLSLRIRAQEEQLDQIGAQNIELGRRRELSFIDVSQRGLFSLGTRVEGLAPGALTLPGGLNQVATATERRAGFQERQADALETLVEKFEKGEITRRTFVADLSAVFALLSGISVVSPSAAQARQTSLFRVSEINHIAIRVADLDRSQKFYEEVLGMNMIFGRSTFRMMANCHRRICLSRSMRSQTIWRNYRTKRHLLSFTAGVAI